MQVLIIDALVNILSGIKINKITDKDTKTILVKDYLQLKKAVQKAKETKQELESKFREDWQDEIFEIARLRKEEKSLAGHEDYVEAEADTIKMINEAFLEDVEVEITPVELDTFIAAVGEESLTLETIAFLQENGVIS